MLTFSTDIVIRGNKAEKYQELKSKYDFELIDTFIISAALGFINNKKDIQSKDSDVTANIPRTVLNSHSALIDDICEYIVLYEDIESDEEQAIKTAFADSSLENAVKLEKLERFIDYSYGGIDILYDELTSDKYADAVDGMKNLLDKYINKSSINIKTTDEIFEEFGL